MNVEVWFHGSLEECATRKRMVDLADGASLGELIDLLSEEYGAELKREIERAEENYIMLNGNYCKLSSERNKLLQDGDIVAFIPILTGG
jgi:molybdopterin converting factor small subunit